MIKIIPGLAVDQHPEIFDAVFALRHKIFVEELGWSDLDSAEQRERDRFDDEHAIHHIALRDGQVVGYQRVIPTEQPHLLSEVLPYLCEGPIPRGRDRWEVSRYCVLPAYRETKRAVGSVGSELIVGVVEWAIANDVNSLIFEFEASWLLRAAQLQFFVRPLGLLHKIGAQQIIAAELTITANTLDTIRGYRDYYAPVVDESEVYAIAS